MMIIVCVIELSFDTSSSLTRWKCQCNCFMGTLFVHLCFVLAFPFTWRQVQSSSFPRCHDTLIRQFALTP